MKMSTNTLNRHKNDRGVKAATPLTPPDQIVYWLMSFIYRFILITVFIISSTVVMVFELA